MTNQTIEERVAALERAVGELKSQQAANPRWWEPLSGAFKDDPVFDEMLEYGRYLRITGTTPPDDWKPGDPIPADEDGE